MKKQRMYFVYGILDRDNKVLYVGLSINPNSRFNDHTRREPNQTLSHGRFYERTDLHLEIFSSFKTREEGRIEEDNLRSKYGFTTERENCRVIAKNREWKPLSEEHKEKIRQSKIGKKRKPFSDEWKKKLGDANRGKKRVFSEEWKINISKGQKKRFLKKSSNA